MHGVENVKWLRKVTSILATMKKLNKNKWHCLQNTTNSKIYSSVDYISGVLDVNETLSSSSVRQYY